ncbi:hypothetical protein [Methanosarcina horonobensis]|uniref:hypothetical protein n=1 Tax=Methanosarcina horonobensis TaxID=418008 RepID=UPI00064FF8EC
MPAYSLIAVLTILPLANLLYKNSRQVLYKISSPWCRFDGRDPFLLSGPVVIWLTPLCTRNGLTG